MHIQVPREQIEAFCRKWKIREFALFGSVLRDDFRPDSDVDVLVEFASDARHSLFDRMDMVEEAEGDVRPRCGPRAKGVLVVNPYRRRHILANHQVLYAAA